MEAEKPKIKIKKEMTEGERRVKEIQKKFRAPKPKGRIVVIDRKLGKGTSEESPTGGMEIGAGRVNEEMRKRFLTEKQREKLPIELQNAIVLKKLRAGEGATRDVAGFAKVSEAEKGAPVKYKRPEGIRLTPIPTLKKTPKEK